VAAISPNVSSGPYTADGTQTAFPFAFSVAAATELAVEIDGAAISPALYTVAFGDTAGTVTFLSAPASGAQILILSAPDFTQASSFENQGAYNLSTVNGINRRASIRDVVLKDLADRAAKAPHGEVGPAIPARADRADKLAAFDGAGDVEALPIAASTLNTLAGLQSEIVAVADNIAPIGIVAANLTGPDTIGTVATNIANVNAAGGSIANVNAVAGALGNVASVAGDLANVNTVAGSIGNVDLAGGSIGNVNAVATDLALGAGASFILRAPQAAVDAVTAAATVAAALPDADKQFRKAYVPGVTWLSARGEAEEVGDRNIDNARIVGGWVLLTKDTLFNAIQWRAWVANVNTAVEWKVFIRTGITTFNMHTTAADASGTISAGGVPTEDVPFTLAMGAPLFAAAGNYVFFFFHTVDDSATISAKTWAYDASVSPARRGVAFTFTAGGWNQNWSEGNAGSGQTFGQISPRLMLTLGEVEAYTQTIRPDLLAALAPKKYGLVGRECNLYLDQIVPDGAASWGFNVEATGVAQIGAQQAERWTLTPTVANSTGTLEVKVADKHNNIVQAQKSVALLIAAANAQAGSTKTVLLLGDSLTADGTIAQTLVDNAAAEAGVMGLTLIGTKGVGSAKHEGVSGVTTNFYNALNAANPFYQGGIVDVSAYLTANSFAVPDYVFIQLGTNNIRLLHLVDFKFTSAAVSYISDLTTTIANVRAAGANIKIVIALPPWPASQDGWGKLFPADKEARAKRNYILFYQMLIAAFGNLEGSKVYLIGSNTSMDGSIAFPRLRQLKHVRVPVAGNYATHAAMIADLTPADGLLYSCTDVPNYWFAKVGPTTKGRWREAGELDGVVRRETDALHPPFGGGAYKQIADEWWALMKVVG
jgi:lysophospholipase L1-like esterase